MLSDLLNSILCGFCYGRAYRTLRIMTPLGAHYVMHTTHTLTHTHTHTHSHSHTQMCCKFLRLNFRWQCILPPSSSPLHDTLGSSVAHIHPYTLIPRYILPRLQFFFVFVTNTNHPREFTFYLWIYAIQFI